MNDLGGNSQEFTFVHSHPKVAYQPLFDELKYSKDQFDGLFEQENLPVHPPSMADFVAQYDMQKAFGKAQVMRGGKMVEGGLRVTGKAIDIANDWTYTVSENNELMENLVKANLETEREMQSLLTAEDKKLIAKAMDDPGIDVRNLSDIMANYDPGLDPTGKIREAGKKFLAIQNRMMEKYKPTIDIYEAISNAGVDVVRAKTEQEREELIKAYTQICEENGIRVTRERGKGQ